MITQLDGVSIWSEDHTQLVTFYRDVLGLPVLMSDDHYTMIGTDSMEKPGVLLGTHSEVKGKNTMPARHMVGFKSTELINDCKRLKEAGVEFIEEPTLYEDLWIATLKDPDGNYVQLYQFQPAE